MRKKCKQLVILGDNIARLLQLRDEQVLQFDNIVFLLCPADHEFQINAICLLLKS
jgi:hypothetical protein